MKKHSIFIGLFSVAFSAILFTFDAQAQPSSGGPTPGIVPTETPIDGGVSLLLAAGVTYGLRRLRERQKS